MSSCPLVRGVVVSPRKNNNSLASKATKISAVSQRPPGTAVQVDTQISIEQSSKRGLDYILSHLQGSHWPRTISTKATQGRLVIITSKEEALTHFKAANYLDCRISAYPYWRPSTVSKFVGIKNPIPPDLVMIDLDICNFGFDDRALKATLRQTLQKIKLMLALIPTVIWSGNGFHIYIPISAVVMEDIKEFAHIDQVSTKFLRFAEWHLSSGKSDSSHNTTVSLNNCMLRIPGSLNSKNNAQVKRIRKWDGNRPKINLLIGSFSAYLRDQEIRERTILKLSPLTGSSSTIQWIEKLLQTPIQDHRKFAIWRVLVPYLINVKGLPSDEAYSIIEDWLNRCNNLYRLNFYPKSRIRESIRGAARGYRPISCEKLKIENNDLYQRLNRN